MPNIGKVSLMITANTKGLETGVGGATNQLRMFEQKSADAGVAGEVSMLRTSLAAEKAAKGFAKLGEKVGLPLGEIESMTGGLLLATKAGKSLSSTLGAVKGALIATGIGALAVGGGLLAALFGGEKEEPVDATAKKIEEAFGEAFKSIVTGARDAESAIADLRLETLSHGLVDAARRLANPAAFDVFREVVFGERVDRVGGALAGADFAEERMRGLLAHPGVREAMEAATRERAARDAARAREAGTERFASMTTGLEEQRIAMDRGADAARLHKAALEGMGAAELMIIAGLQAANAEQARQIELQNQAVAMTQEMMRQGAAIFDRTRTPLEAFTAQLENLDRLLENNAFGDGIDQVEAWGRAIGMAVGQLEAAVGHTRELGSTAALGAGTQAAFSAINAAQRDASSAGETPEERMRRIMEAAEEANQRSRDDLQEILRLARQGFFGQAGG